MHDVLISRLYTSTYIFIYLAVIHLGHTNFVWSNLYVKFSLYTVIYTRVVLHRRYAFRPWPKCELSTAIVALLTSFHYRKQLKEAEEHVQNINT